MKALLYDRSSGVVIGGASASREEDIAARADELIGYILSDIEWRDAKVDLTDPQNPQAILKEP